MPAFLFAGFTYTAVNCSSRSEIKTCLVIKGLLFYTGCFTKLDGSHQDDGALQRKAEADMDKGKLVGAHEQIETLKGVFYVVRL